MSPVSRGRRKKRPTTRPRSARRVTPRAGGVHAELLRAFRPAVQRGVQVRHECAHDRKRAKGEMNLDPDAKSSIFEDFTPALAPGQDLFWDNLALSERGIGR